jgi:hypothetical protein
MIDSQTTSCSIRNYSAISTQLSAFFELNFSVSSHDVAIFCSKGKLF